MKVIVQLKGGLGNQLFQYATGRALADRGGVPLVVDGVSGFARDRRFRRTYELSQFSATPAMATGAARLGFELDRLLRRLPGGSGSVRRMPWGDLLRETQQRYLPEIAAFRPSRATWLSGYWQSPRYFDAIASDLRRELEPKIPEDPKMVDLGRRMAERESVAIGVRLYEEAANPAVCARDGQVKTVAQQADAVHAVLREHPGSTPYVFCTHRAPALEDLRMPPGTIFVTESDGFRGAVANLWLLTRCRHHVFNNSTFYWWGAWLSEGRSGHGAGAIFASDNFINPDGLPDHWRRF